MLTERAGGIYCRSGNGVDFKVFNVAAVAYRLVELVADYRDSVQKFHFVIHPLIISSEMKKERQKKKERRGLVL